MTTVGEAEIIVVANTAGFNKSLTTGTEKGLAQAEKTVESSGVRMGQKLEHGMKGPLAGIQKMLAGLGIPEQLLTGKALGLEAVGALGVEFTHLAIGQQKANTAIATSAGISVKAANDIGNAFLTTAGKSEFSGKEMSAAFATVAGQLKATQGQALTTADAMEYMKSVDELATAKQIDLGTATSTVAGLLQAFQLSANNASSATDVLFNASNMTGQSIEAIAMGLEKLRAKLGATAPPMGDLAGLMVSMTKNGITGRAAIAGVNAAMIGLQAASEGVTAGGVTAEKTLNSFGVSAKGAHGTITPLGDIIAGLAPRFAKMTQAQQLAAASMIFGANAGKQMVAVIDAGASAYRKTTADVQKFGAAHDAAEKQSKTMAVQIKTLKAAFEDIGTSIGQLLLPALTMLAGAFVWVVQKILPLAKYIGEHKPLLIGLAIAIGAVVIPSLVSLGITLGAVAVEFIGAGLAATGAFIAMIAPVAAVVAAIALVGFAIYELVTHFKQVMHWLRENWWMVASILFAPIAPVLLAWHFFHKQITGVFDSIRHHIANVWDGMRHEAAHLVDNVITFFESIPGRIVKALKNGASAVAHAFMSMIPGGGVIGSVLGGVAHLFADGGVVTKPTLGIIGEAGPEVVVPLKNFGSHANAIMAGGGVSPLPTSTMGTSTTTTNAPTIHVHVYGSDLRPHDIASELAWQFKTGQLV